MGQEHWARHAAKAPPVKEYDLNDSLRVIIRDRGRSFGTARQFSATAVYKQPPRPGQLVFAVAYGSTAPKAEVALLAMHSMKGVLA
jgi:hypothetical protein